MDIPLVLAAIAWKWASCFIFKPSNLQNQIVLAIHVFRGKDDFYAAVSTSAVFSYYNAAHSHNNMNNVNVLTHKSVGDFLWKYVDFFKSKFFKREPWASSWPSYHLAALIHCSFWIVLIMLGVFIDCNIWHLLHLHLILTLSLGGGVGTIILYILYQMSSLEVVSPVSWGGAGFPTPVSQGSACIHVCFGFYRVTFFNLHPRIRIKWLFALKTSSFRSSINQ